MRIEYNDEYNNGDNNDEDTMIRKEMKALIQFIIALEKARDAFSSIYTSDKDIDAEKKRSRENITTNASTSSNEDSCERYKLV